MYDWQTVMSFVNAGEEKRGEAMEMIEEMIWLEVRHCSICGTAYKYDHGCGSDLRCCSKECEEQLLDEMYEQEGEEG